MTEKKNYCDYWRRCTVIGQMTSLVCAHGSKNGTGVHPFCDSWNPESSRCDNEDAIKQARAEAGAK